MAQGQINGAALASLTAGSLFLYAGIRGKSVLAVVQGVVQGKAPATAPQANPVTDTTQQLADASPASALAGVAGDSAIASAAVKYQGAGYVWGGAPARGIGIWDCSSFANWVIGHDLGRAIPLYKAGSYDGSSHGPPTMMWLAWTGCATIGSDGAAALPGDLAVWPTHMGICLGGGNMISALNSQLGTKVTTISGGSPGGEPLLIRRLK
jgi:cell wall-associated NlpC family hydrolase